MADSEDGKKKSSCGCCFLKILGVCLLIGGILIAIGVYMFMNTANWIANAAEAAPAQYPPLTISAGEKEDVARVIQKLQTGKQQKELIDETITPNVFNGIVDAIIQDNKDKGKKNELEDFRLAMDGDLFQVALTVKPDNPNAGTPPAGQKYTNIQSKFDLEIEGGKLTKATIKSLAAGGKEAPFVVRWGVNAVLENLKTNPDPKLQNDMKKLGFIKVLKREGDRIHIILDPQKFETPPDAAPESKPDAPKVPGKEAF